MSGRRQICFVGPERTDIAADTRYYPDAAGWDMGKVHSYVEIFGSQVGGVTWTVEATDKPRFDEGAEIWEDISKAFVDLTTGLDGGASWIDQAVLKIQLNGFSAERLRIKEVTSDATNIVTGYLRLGA
jgi:hypothetical protein